MNLVGERADGEDEMLMSDRQTGDYELIWLVEGRK